MQPLPFQTADQLRFGRPDWVRSLARGAGFSCWGLLLGSAACAASELLDPRPAALLCRWIAAVAGACLVYGAWLLSAGDPNGSTPASDRLVRWTLRGTLFTAAVGGLFECALVTVPAGHDVQSTLSTAVPLIAAVDVAGRVAFLRHLRRLALRIPDARMASRLGSLVPPYGLALLALATCDALRAVPMLDRLGPAAALALTLVTLIVTKHLRQLRRGLHIQTDYARGIWSRSPAAHPSASGLAA